MTDSAGSRIGSTVKYLPFGGIRVGSVPTDKLFTGQRLDATGLYYYNARYYDATIGRFISPDNISPDFSDPQTLNRYTYCYNNPLRYTDPSGHDVESDYWALYNFAQQKTENEQKLNTIATEINDPTIFAAAYNYSNAPLPDIYLKMMNNVTSEELKVISPEPASPPTLTPTKTGASTQTTQKSSSKKGWAEIAIGWLIIGVTDLTLTTVTIGCALFAPEALSVVIKVDEYAGTALNGLGIWLIIRGSKH